MKVSIKNTCAVFMILALYLPASIYAQTGSLGDELKKIRNAYILNKQLSFDVEAYSYASKNTSKADLISKGSMRKSNSRYYSHFQDYELVVNGEKMVLVNNQSKIISYYDYKIKQQKIPDNFQVNIDSLLLNTDSVVMRPDKNGDKHFTAFSKTGYIKQTEIYTDSKTHLVKHLLYYYVPSTEEYEIDVDRVEVFYKNIKTQFDEEQLFTFDRYFKNNKSRFIPVGKYQGYKMNYYNSKS